MSTSLPFRRGVVADEWLASSGQVGLEDDVLVDGPRAQTAQALANLRQVLEAHGAGSADVVKTNVLFVSMDDYAVMNEEYAKVSASEPRPDRRSSSTSFRSARWSRSRHGSTCPVSDQRRTTDESACTPGNVVGHLP